MKLPLTQHRDILTLLSKSGFDESKIFFVKRKGRIRISIEGNEGFFEFFKRKGVEITETQQWEKTVQFEIKTETSVFTLGEWSEVVKAMEVWAAGQSRRGNDINHKSLSS